MNKRIHLSVFRLWKQFFFSGMCFFYASSVTASPVIRVVPDNTHPENGQEVTVDVNVDLAGSSSVLGAYSFVVTWDPQVLFYSSVTGGTSQGYGSVNLNVSKTSGGSLIINKFYVPPSGYKPDTSLYNVAKIKFFTVGTVGNSTSITVTVSSLAAARTFANLKPGHEVQPCTITVKSHPQIASANIAPIKDLQVEKNSENYIELSWTAPSLSGTNQPVAAYAVEMSVTQPSGEVLHGVTFDPQISPQTPGSKETLKISNLKPGTLYYIAVRSIDRDGRASNNSHIISSSTQIGFIDEDLDPHDPFVLRDADSLFVSDNDMFLHFIWSPVENAAGTVYQVRIYSEQDQTIIGTKTVDSAEYILEAPEAGYYSIEVTPLLKNGDTLPSMRSRVIGCSSQELNPPGRPVLTVNGRER
jgi:hypothetical protein